MLAPAQQSSLLSADKIPLTSMKAGAPFRTQLLKWVGNKQSQAVEIMRFFPKKIGTYYEPFLGSGGILGSLAPAKAVASDAFVPLIKIWQTLHADKELLKQQYSERFAMMGKLGKSEAYRAILANYNIAPNSADLLFLCRSCYGGVVRFRKKDGYMSTPVGAHAPISPESFAMRVDAWHARTQGVDFLALDFADAMQRAQPGDLIYCDPPYTDSQSILYGAQTFSFERLLEAIETCKLRGVQVALSIDGTKFSDRKLCNVPIPKGLFARTEYIAVGRSMLKRFQMDGQSLAGHEVRDRLLLTYDS